MKGLNLITAQELALIQGMTPPAEADQEKIDAIDEAVWEARSEWEDDDNYDDSNDPYITCMSQDFILNAEFLPYDANASMESIADAIIESTPATLVLDSNEEDSESKPVKVVSVTFHANTVTQEQTDELLNLIVAHYGKDPKLGVMVQTPAPNPNLITILSTY
ncbi:hypothetical protein [Bifidobacterium canis]|uniref:Uncharacterized protein n=1 Tax=Bifidobacterium canis TaxID=2610880 RepID=A0A7K1J412_9BIFI|nr:hypothetical protein [Bifidobacterium canis]MUH59281.1 hypothetical protein [Bifidobacterium canis]